MAALTESQFADLAARLLSVGVTGLRPLPGGGSSMTFAAVLPSLLARADEFLNIDANQRNLTNGG